MKYLLVSSILLAGCANTQMAEMREPLDLPETGDFFQNLPSDDSMSKDQSEIDETQMETKNSDPNDPSTDLNVIQIVNLPTVETACTGADPELVMGVASRAIRAYSPNQTRDQYESTPDNERANTTIGIICNRAILDAIYGE